MATRVGTYDISTLLATATQSVAEFGVDNVAAVVAADLAVHNAIMTDAVSQLAEVSTDRQRLSGGSTSNDMHEVDEYGMAPTQIRKNPSPVAFPLRKFQRSLGWTDDWFQLHTPMELATALEGVQISHTIKVVREIQRALFLSSDFTFNDFLVDKVPLAVKRLVNADGADIPDGPNGQSFDGTTHNHYLATASLTAANILSLIQTVIEHGYGGTIRLVISTTDVAAVSALTGFVPLQDVRLTLSTASNQPTERLDVTRADNRKIGLFGSAEVWTKPWGLAGYLFCYDASAQGRPLVMRERPQATLRGLRLAGKTASFPLYAETMQAEFGFGVWTRTNGAVLYTGSGTYADPTIPT